MCLCVLCLGPKKKKKLCQNMFYDEAHGIKNKKAAQRHTFRISRFSLLTILTTFPFLSPSCRLPKRKEGGISQAGSFLPGILVWPHIGDGDCGTVSFDFHLRPLQTAAPASPFPLKPWHIPGTSPASSQSSSQLLS